MAKPINEIIQVANHHALALPNETHQSLPIPVFESSETKVCFLYCPAAATPDRGLVLFAPTHRTLVHAGSGRFEVLEEILPDDVVDEEIGSATMPAGMSREEYVRQRSRLIELYDVLIGPFSTFAGRGGKDLGENAKEFLDIFPVISEAPLQPHYQSVGQDFFDWLEKVRE